jgi:hypothetical protein
MERLPKEIALEYRAATLYEVRSWSFGQLKAVRELLPPSWQQRKGTLDDDGIFGPRRDYECACGKYRGIDYERMKCDICGVKIASHELRRSRFAHIELAYPIPHPLVTPASTLDAIPVLPARFWESNAGARLATSYEDVIRANGMRDPHRLIESVSRVFGVLLPVALIAHQWSLEDTVVLAQGLALVARSEEVNDLDLPR